MTGTSHVYGGINVNIKSNYLPKNITNSKYSCLDLCQELLVIKITRSYQGSTSISSQYLPGSHSFAASIEFGV